MTSKVVFLSQLAEPSQAEEFEHFVRDELLPLVRAFPSVHSYVVSRLDGYLEGREGSPAWHYVDVAVVTSVSAYETDVAAMLLSDAGAHFEKLWSTFVTDWIPLHGEDIE